MKGRHPPIRPSQKIWNNLQIAARIKLYSEELNDPHSSPTIVRVIKIENEMGRACSTFGDFNF
jgi:hypothetical protein